MHDPVSPSFGPDSIPPILEDLILRPALSRFSDLVVIRGMMCRAPVRHIFNMILVEDYCRPPPLNEQPFCIPLFVPRRLQDVRTQAVVGLPRVEWRHLTPADFDRIRARLTKTGIPTIRRVATIESYVSFKDRYRFRALNEITRAYMHIAFGEFEAALQIGRRAGKPRAEYVPALERLIELTPMLAVRDREGIAHALREIEAERVRSFGIEGIWKPTPFPFEIAEGERPRGSAHYAPPKRRRGPKAGPAAKAGPPKGPI